MKSYDVTIYIKAVLIYLHSRGTLYSVLQDDLNSFTSVNETKILREHSCLSCVVVRQNGYFYTTAPSRGNNLLLNH